MELNDKDAEIYFATMDENAIGYLKLNFGQSQTEIKYTKGLQIECIHVSKEFY